MDFPMDYSEYSLAILNDDLETLRDLLYKNSMSNNDSKVKDGDKLLHWVVGHCDTVERIGAANLLIQHGIEVNIRDSQGNTPLHVVSGSMSREMTDFLLNSGADVNPLNNKGHTPLYNATFFNSTDERILPLLLNEASLSVARPCRLPERHVGSMGNFATIYDHFIDCEMGINTVDKKTGNSPLHYAMMYGNTQLAKELLKRGANVYLVNKMLCTPLHLAFLSNGYIKDGFCSYLLNYSGHHMYSYDEDIISNLNAELLSDAFEEDDFINKNSDFQYDNVLIIEQYFDYVTNANQVNTKYYSTLKHAIKLIVSSVRSYLHNWNYLMVIIIKIVAKYSMKGVIKGKDLLNSIDHEFIAYEYQIEEIYEKYLDELTKLKNCIIYKRITFFDILTNDFDKIVFYLQDKNFIENFEKSQKLILNNKYMKSIYRKIIQAKELKELNEKSLLTLTKIFELTIPLLAIKNILCYLDVSDKRILSYQQPLL